ncbi:MAG: hypothetical protein WC979_02030 [Candidatus Pacearchaeota archaeon]|jgi:hypothetical protein|nr:hypothetical protein [Clostridia bacterium]
MTAIKITPKNSESKYVALNSKREIISEGIELKKVIADAEKITDSFSILPLASRPIDFHYRKTIES